jgi:hypothetical protein
MPCAYQHGPFKTRKHMTKVEFIGHGSSSRSFRSLELPTSMLLRLLLLLALCVFDLGLFSSDNSCIATAFELISVVFI